MNAFAVEMLAQGFWAKKISDMRPLGLQNVCLKWVTTTSMLPPTDVFPQIIPIN